jgi:hypothetical protein
MSKNKAPKRLSRIQNNTFKWECKYNLKQQGESGTHELTKGLPDFLIFKFCLPGSLATRERKGDNGKMAFIF